MGGQIYIGGQGEDGLVPVPFPIPGSAGTKGGNNKTRNSQKAVAGVLSMNDPIDLLDALRCQQSDNEQCNTIRRISKFLFVLLLSDTVKEAPMTKLKRKKRRSLERTKPKRKLRSHQRWITHVT